MFSSFSISSIARISIFVVVYLFMQILLQIGEGLEISITSVASYLIAGFSIGLLMYLIFARLPFSKMVCIGLAWLNLFVIQQLNNLIEALFFTTYLSSTSLFLGAVIAGLIITFVEALLIVLLFTQRKEVRSYIKEFREYLSQRTTTAFILRIIAASILYLPVYFAFGSLIAPYVTPYYYDPSFGLKIPDISIVIPLEIFRGFLYVIALLPIIAVLKIYGKHLWTALTALLYIPGGFANLISPSIMPAPLRLIHGLEILADSIVYAAILTYMFGRKVK